MNKTDMNSHVQVFCEDIHFLFSTFLGVELVGFSIDVCFTSLKTCLFSRVLVQPSLVNSQHCYQLALALCQGQSRVRSHLVPGALLLPRRFAKTPEPPDAPLVPVLLLVAASGWHKREGAIH